jgi:FHS family glucose/mannose:H+ symporter-like MFS transporter
MALDPAVIILAWVLFFYSAIEISTAGWIRTYLETEFHAAAQTSKTILTAFWVMMMIGRLAASQVVKRIRGPRLVLGASAGATIGLALLAVSPSVAVATAAIIICGLSYASVFPTTAGTASTYFFNLFGTVFGILMTLALFSGAVVPPAVGYIAQRVGVRSGMGLLAAIALLLLVTQGIFNRYERLRFLSKTAH